MNFLCREDVFRMHADKNSSQRFSLVTLVYGSNAHACVIFFLTSLFIDSIHSISRNKIPLRESMNNGRENRSMATKKKAKAKAKKKKKKH